MACAAHDHALVEGTGMLLPAPAADYLRPDSLSCVFSPACGASPPEEEVHCQAAQPLGVRRVEWCLERLQPRMGQKSTVETSLTSR